MTYSSSGAPTGNIWISKPTSVAVDANGLIYIGTNENLSVKILDPSYNVIGSLGSGAGEFSLPRNIAIDDATGNVYVVDQIDQSIKIYTSSGTFVKKISDYPNLPQDVTVMNNKIYVIDHPLITDQWGGRIRGAKVRVFDMDGNVLDDETFGSYGDQEGQFVRPAGITSDTEGVLYISDSFHGVVMCFTADGTYLGAIQDASNPMVTPMGIALGEDRRLLVASLNTGSIHVFGLEGYTEPEGIDVSPSSLAFAAEEGQANPPEQSLTISNNGSEVKTYTASADQDWIVLDTTSVTVDDGSTGTIPVGVDATELGMGTYDGQVTITDGTGAMVNIPVTLEVTMPIAQPELNVSPESLDFTYKVGTENPASQKVTVDLADGTTWAAEADVTWITIEPATGQGDMSIVTVSIDPTGLGTGDHTGTITVSADADGSPASIAVTLTVLNGGAIQVTCNIEEASFSIEGPEGATYEGSGETWSVSEVPDGTYTITYNQVIGYRTPSSETKELSNAEPITFEGTYESLAMDADIVVSCENDRRQRKSVGIFDEEGTMVFSFVPYVRNKKEKTVDKNRVLNTAVGDIDGDGKEDIVLGFVKDSLEKEKEVAVYRKDGTLLVDGGNYFKALKGKESVDGVNVAVADFDGDGKAEIVIGTRSNENKYALPAYVKVLSYESGELADKGIMLEAFAREKDVNVAAGDVDGDGIPELITVPGPNMIAKPEVRVWKVDTSGANSWTVTDTGIRFFAFPGYYGDGALKYGANVTTGDLNGDGTDEIIVASGPDPQININAIKVFNGDGTEFGLEISNLSDLTAQHLSVASADLDSDGIAEIVVGIGEMTILSNATRSFNYSSRVKIYKVEEDGGILLFNSFEAFDDICIGAVVSVGDLGY
jgi:hypothetical protein